MTNPAAGMAERQGATRPPWLGRSRWRLVADVTRGWRLNLAKLAQLGALVATLFRPSVVRRRLERLRALGHVDATPTLPQLLVAARDQMMVSASEETKLFYRAQGIPWVFHNLRRFLSGPATMLDPMGLLSPPDAIIHHVLQTFHRHPVYDLVLLRAHEGGVAEMERQAALILAGKHPHQRALTSLIEDGSYHARLPHEIAAFQADPHAPARPIPEGLVDDPHMMLAMDQFKDMRGFVGYAARLRARYRGAVAAWLAVAFDETLGSLLGLKLGPRHVPVEACEPGLVAEVSAHHHLEQPWRALWMGRTVGTATPGKARSGLGRHRHRLAQHLAPRERTIARRTKMRCSSSSCSRFLNTRLRLVVVGLVGELDQEIPAGVVRQLGHEQGVEQMGDLGVAVRITASMPCDSSR